MGAAVPGGGFLGRMILAGAAKGPAAVGRWSWFTSALEVTIQDAGIIWDLCASKWPTIWSLNLFEHLKIRENALKNSMNFSVTETNEISTFWYLSLITGLLVAQFCVPFPWSLFYHGSWYWCPCWVLPFFFPSQHWCEHENPDEPETDVSWMLCQCGQALQHSESAVLLAVHPPVLHMLWQAPVVLAGDWTQTQQGLMVQQEEPRLSEHKDCESKKAKGIFCPGFLPASTSWSWICVTVPVRNPVWVWSVQGARWGLTGCLELPLQRGFSPSNESLGWCRCDPRNGTWRVRQESFLNIWEVWGHRAWNGSWQEHCLEGGWVFLFCSISLPSCLSHFPGPCR